VSSRAFGILIFVAQALWAMTAPAASAQDKPPATVDSIERPVIAVVPRDWPPQYSLDDEGRPAGFAIDVMNEIAARAGLKVIYRVMDNFAAVEEAMAAGQGDIIPNSGITPERFERYSFTAPVQTTVISIIVRSKTVGIENLADLAGRHVGVVATNVGEKIIEPYRSVHPVVLPDAGAALFELLSGHVDALIHAPSVVMALAREVGVADRIKSVGKPLAEIKRAIRVRKDRPELLAALDKAVRDFVGTPGYQRIYVRWYGKPASLWSDRRIIWAIGSFFAALLILFALWRYRLIVQTNRRIAASEEKFRDLVEGAVPGVMIHRDERPLFVNRSYADIFGYDSPEEVLRQETTFHHVAPRDRERLRAYASARLRGEQPPAVYEFQGVKKDGSLIWLENRGRVVDWEGAPAIQRTVVDVTEKRNAEAASMLRSSQQAVVAELGQQALAYRDVTALMNTAVTLAAKLLEADLCGLFELLPGGDKSLLRAGVGWKPGLVGRATADTGEFSEAGYTLLTRGPVVVEDWRAETRIAMPPLLRDHGAVSGITVIVGDPTQPFGVLGAHTKARRVFSADDVLFLKTIAIMLASAIARKRADDALRASEDHLRGAIESMQEGFVLYDADDRMVMMNDEYRRFAPDADRSLKSRAPFEEIVRFHVENGLIVDAVGREEAFVQERLAQHRDPKGPILRRHSNGKWYIIKETRTPEGGTAVTFTDITELKRADQALNQAEQQFQIVVDNLPMAINVKDMDGHYVLANKLFEKWWGLSAGEIVGKRPEDLSERLRATSARRRRHEQAVIDSKQVITRDDRIKRPDGEIHDVEIVKFPVLDANGEVALVGTIGSDVTERKRAEQSLAELQAELAHVSRISSMGEMAAGLAHELNQPLTAITNYAKGTLRRLHAGGGDSVDLMPIMELIAEQALRAGDIIRKIRGFMNRSEPKKTRINLRHVIDEVMALLAGEINMSGIEIAIEVSKSLPPVMADSIQVQQVLLNLIRNSVAAMNGDGANHHRLEVGAKAESAGGVEIHVTDNGPGVPPDVVERLFEPFFTTKTDGLGMGLSISRSIVTGHNGRIWFSSTPGQGASFHFTLPTDTGGAHDPA